jgi:hypothetical protein
MRLFKRLGFPVHCECDVCRLLGKRVETPIVLCLESKQTNPPGRPALFVLVHISHCADTVVSNLYIYFLYQDNINLCAIRITSHNSQFTQPFPFAQRNDTTFSQSLNLSITHRTKVKQTRHTAAELKGDTAVSFFGE